MLFDAFFRQKKCSRCPNTLFVRTMSWFNNDTICMDCSKAEDEIKLKLRKQGKDPAKFEGCGFIPQIKET